MKAVAGVAAAAFAAALALGACGGDSDKSSTTDMTDGGSTETTAGGGSATGDTIVIKDFKFGPETLKVKVGDTIKVTNKDSATHTLTALDKSFDTKNLDEGASATITVSKAGTVEYQCNIHDYMKGTIEVG